MNCKKAQIIVGGIFLALFLFVGDVKATDSIINNASLTAQRLFVGQYNNTKYNVITEDPDGVAKLIVKKANGDILQSGEPLYGTSPCGVKIETGTVTLNPTDFPLTATVNDCKNVSVTQTVTVSMPPIAATPSLIVISPNGGEDWIRSTVASDSITWPGSMFLQHIKWSGGSSGAGWVNGDPNLARAYLEKMQNGQFITVGRIVPAAAGSIGWVVGSLMSSGCLTFACPPYFLADPGEYYVRIIDTVTGATDRSDAPFTILPAPPAQPSVTVTSPNGGEKWERGKTYKVQWNSANLAPQNGYISLSLYSSDNPGIVGIGGVEIPNGVNFFDFYVPTTAPLGNYYFQAVSCLEVSNGIACSLPSGNPYYTSDISDASLTIVAENSIARSITVISPNGGEVWQIGKTYKITWSSTEVKNVMIYIYNTKSTAGSGSTNYITEQSIPASKGYYEWIINEQKLPLASPSDSYHIRVDSDDELNNVTVRDSSDASFSIVANNDSKSNIVVNDSDHIRGDKDALVTLVEFSDAQCPYCQKFNTTLKQIIKDYDGKARWVYRHFPLGFHQYAQKAAEASECASAQNKFWEYSDLIYENFQSDGSNLSLENLKKYAEKLNLNLTDFNSCLDSGKFVQKVSSDMASGTQAGVTGTPTTFVMNKYGSLKIVHGAVDYSEVASAIEWMIPQTTPVIPNDDNNQDDKKMIAYGDDGIDVNLRDQIAKLKQRVAELEKLVVETERRFLTKIDEKLTERLKGRILLQVEGKGEAWYVDPKSEKKFYMANGDSAYEMLRKFGLGVTNKDLEKIPVGIEDRAESQFADSDSDGLSDKLEESLGTNPNNKDSDNDGFLDGAEVKSGNNPLGSGKLTASSSLAKRLYGKILLQVEDKGQAWYVLDGKRYYMKDGDAAYQIMRFLSLGVNNNDIRKIDVGEVGQ